MAKELKLSAEYIPPSLMQTMEWYAPVRSGFTWFYHESRLYLPSSTTTPTTYIDPLLRPIIRCLNEKNIETLASCQGHFYNEEDLNRIYERLKEDEEIIRTEGLLLRNLTTQEVVTYKDPNYFMPEFGKLASELLTFSGVGYFSYLADRGDDLVLLNLTREIGRCSNTRMTFAPARNSLIVNVQVDTKEDNHEQVWAELTTCVLGQLALVPKKRNIVRPRLDPSVALSGVNPTPEITQLVFIVSIISFLANIFAGFYLLKLSTYSLLSQTTQTLLMLISIVTIITGLVRFVRRVRFYNQLKETENS